VTEEANFYKKNWRMTNKKITLTQAGIMPWSNKINAGALWWLLQKVSV
jgi:hypothetical protein